jgi:hypothetical protein
MTVLSEFEIGVRAELVNPCAVAVHLRVERGMFGRQVVDSIDELVEAVIQVVGGAPIRGECQSPGKRALRFHFPVNRRLTCLHGPFQAVALLTNR